MRISTTVLGSITILAGFGLGWSAGCASQTGNDTGGGGGNGSGGSYGAPDSGPGSAECPLCMTGSDCSGGEFCAQFQGDSFCAPPCGVGGTCSSGRTCAIQSSFNGQQVSVCVPDNNACMATMNNPPPPADAGCPPPPACDAGSPDMCGSLAGPSVSSSCSSCSSSSSSCQPNGCYGGWWCDTSTSRCQSPPNMSMCPAPMCPPAPPCGSQVDSGGTGGGSDAGSGTASLTGSGGTVGALVFAAIGDTRPANEDDTAGYPTTIITKIFSDIQAASPTIPFVVATGDYEFANPSGSQSGPQLNLYMGARAGYSGMYYPAMGNHECTGYTSSNCGSGSSDGVTNNYSTFISTMLGPISQTKPYYSVNINATDGSWTAKFVFVAANAWDSAQSSWLSSTLGVKTTYTFVMRHEEDSANTAPGVSPSQRIIDSNPLTLEIVGHSHTYEWVSSREVIVGNGGAPLTGGGNYGYALIQRESSGDITVDMVDYESGSMDSSFHRQLTP